MKWFGRKAVRGTGRPLLFSGWKHVFAAEPWPRGYEAQVREAYLANPVAQRAVRLVAESVAWAPVYAQRMGTVTSDCPRAVALLTPALLETVASQLLLHGNAFVQILPDAQGAPAELFALRPERVTVETDAAGWPADYVYKVGNAKTRLPARDGLGRPSLVHVKAVHPLDDHYGLGLPRRGGGRGGGPQCGGEVEQGAARQCGAAVGGFGLRARRRRQRGAVGAAI